LHTPEIFGINTKTQTPQEAIHMKTSNIITIIHALMVKTSIDQGEYLNQIASSALAGAVEQHTMVAQVACIQGQRRRLDILRSLLLHQEILLKDLGDEFSPDDLENLSWENDVYGLMEVHVLNGREQYDNSDIPVMDGVADDLHQALLALARDENAVQQIEGEAAHYPR